MLFPNNIYSRSLTVLDLTIFSYWLLVVGYWLLVIGYLSRTTHYSLLTTHLKIKSNLCCAVCNASVGELLPNKTDSSALPKLSDRRL